MSARRSPILLTPDEIARAALGLIDAEGLAGFSMRKLGARLGVDPMAIYRRFDDQEALFDAVAAEMFRGVDIRALPWESSWPELLHAYGVALRHALLAHTAALPVYGTRPVRSPDAVEWAVRGLLKMAEAGVPSPDALQIALCVNEYVIGHAMAVTADLTAAHRNRRPDADSAGANVLAAAAASLVPGAHFEVGLQALIDGLYQASLHRSE